jgi:hypothetical protein
MRQRLPLLLFSLLFTAFSCSEQADQSGTSATQATGEEIDPHQNLVFSFDESVVPASQANRWDTTQYVRFEPAIKGKFKWINEGRELVFSPLEPFQPSTAFAATLHAASLPLGKQKLTLSRPRFHTPFLALSGAQVFYGYCRAARQCAFQLSRAAS